MATKRMVLVVLAISVIALGVGSRRLEFESPLLNKYLGDALYAVMFYLFLSLIWERGRPLLKAALVWLLMVSIELFQLTGIPLKLRREESVLARSASILLGTEFSWLDLLAYLAGIAMIVTVDLAVFEKGGWRRDRWGQ